MCKCLRKKIRKSYTRPKEQIFRTSFSKIKFEFWPYLSSILSCPYMLMFGKVTSSVDEISRHFNLQNNGRAFGIYWYLIKCFHQSESCMTAVQTICCWHYENFLSCQHWIPGFAVTQISCWSNFLIRLNNKDCLRCLCRKISDVLKLSL